MVRDIYFSSPEASISGIFKMGQWQDMVHILKRMELRLRDTGKMENLFSKDKLKWIHQSIGQMESRKILKTQILKPLMHQAPKIVQNRVLKILKMLKMSQTVSLKLPLLNRALNRTNLHSDFKLCYNLMFCLITIYFNLWIWTSSSHHFSSLTIGKIPFSTYPFA